MAKDAGFDLAAMLADLNEVPDSGTGREQIEYIDLDLIDEDKDNFYATEEIEALAANIATVGLLDPLRLRANPDKPGRYIAVSGHRRRKALGLLKEEDPARWGEVACIVEETVSSPALQELRLIFANKDNRKMTAADVSEQAVRVEKLLCQLQEEGYPFPGRMRDHVAEVMQVSKTKLSNLKVIRENLDQVWQTAFRKNVIKESAALALARMPKVWQKILFDAYKEHPGWLYEGDVKNYMASFAKIEKIKCKLDGHSCSNVRRMLEKTASHCNSYSDKCEKCCLKCENLRMCKYYCPYAADARDLAKRAYQDMKAVDKANELAKIEPELQIGRGVYQRWFHALNANELTTEEYLEKCGSRYYGSDAKTFQKYGENPEKLQKTEVKLPFSQNLYASDVKSLVAAADVLGCSIDWLLGRDVPAPIEEMAKPAAGGWQTEDPDESLAGDRFVVLCKWSTYGVVRPYIMEWSGDCWDYDGHDAREAGAIILGWMPMLEEV